MVWILTYRDFNVLVDARLERICVAVEQLLALSLRDGCVDAVAFPCCLAGMPVADGSYALTMRSARLEPGLLVGEILTAASL